MKFGQKVKNSIGLFMEKLNPAQPTIQEEEGTTKDTTIRASSVIRAYETVEVVQRGTNLIVESAASISLDIKDKLHGVGQCEQVLKKKRLELLVNFQPNPYQNIDAFRRAIFLDLILEGNAFIYFDGAHMYHLPAKNVEILTDKKTFIKGYRYDEDTTFTANEIMFIKENSARTIYRGESRLKSTMHTLNALTKMLQFQTTFFDNNAIPGMIATTPNILSEKVKQRILDRWIRDYRPSKGGRKPMLLDGDWKITPMTKGDFRELDFTNSIKVHENAVLKALGVPPILLDSGNNANISPNLKMFYINTILPLYDRYVKALEFYFGYDMQPVTQDILALRPELQELGNYLSTLTNAGIMTRNESREAIRLVSIDDDENADRLILPANVAGSAQFANEGGAPKKPDDSKNEPKK